MLLTSCGIVSEIIKETKEVCNSSGEVFLTLSENYRNWVEYFEDLPLSSDNGITINLSNDLYVVRSLYQTDEGTPIISIRTWDTYPVTFLGNAGYFYVPDGDISFFPSEYQVEQMLSNIYCYLNPEVVEVAP
jgi:hypothetical protein